MQTNRLVYAPKARIFAQGDPASSVMYVDKGVVRLSVLSHTGKEVVVGLIEAGHFSEKDAWRASPTGWPPRRR